MSKTASRLNNMLKGNNKLPSKFAPSRDYSDSVDKIFNNSRDHLHASLEVTANNHSRE